MIRYTITVLAMALCPSPSQAEPIIPPWCCPSTCEVLDSKADTVRSTEEKGSSILGRYEKTFPHSRDFFRGNAPDGLTRICFGFDALGSPEIKCILSPLPLI